MSTFRRLTNLAKGLVTTEVRKWTEPEPADLSGELRSGPRSTPPGSAASRVTPEVAPPLPVGPERDEHGEVKRTL